MDQESYSGLMTEEASASGEKDGNGAAFSREDSRRQDNGNVLPHVIVTTQARDLPVYQEHQLNRLLVSELQAIARIEGVRHYWCTPRRQLIMEIVKQQLRRGARIRCKGVLELTHDNHGYLRNPVAHLQAQCSDPFVPVQIIREHGLYGGLELSGHLRQPRSGDKHLVMNEVDLVENESVAKMPARRKFDGLTALFPKDRLFLEIPGDDSRDSISRRVVDIIAPIGKGQRGIIVAPPRVGKTILMRNIVQSIERNHPEVTIIVLLLDERPEEVTSMQEAIRGHVIASTFDEKPVRHIQVAGTALARARVLVENGKDVVLFLDSITRLARAFNNLTGNQGGNHGGNHGRLMSGGIETTALQRTKQFFGTARNIESGGSLTIIGTALIDTGSRMDQVIFEEFKGTGNMEIYLDRSVAAHRIYPALNIIMSGTRKDDLLMAPEEYQIVSKIRKTLHSMVPMDAIVNLIEQLRRHKTNAEFLMSVRNSLS